MPSSCLRPKVSTLGQLNRGTSDRLRVEDVAKDRVAPPRLDGVQPDGTVLRILQGEEDDHDGEGVTG